MRFSHTPHVSTDFEPQADEDTRLGRITSNLEPLRSSQQMWTARVSSAIDHIAGNNA